MAALALRDIARILNVRITAVDKAVLELRKSRIVNGTLDALYLTKHGEAYAQRNRGSITGLRT
ncbi:hypothetical protein BGM09_00985 [Streptomyces sp. CBMA29]|nr:hypothetical protein [Streptomyces sp. CBMA29]